MTLGTPRGNRLFEARHTVIPYYVQSIQAGITALSLSKQHHPLDRIELSLENVDAPVDSTILIAYTQTISSMAAIYSRLLLEFLGLRSGGNPSKLIAVKDRRPSDIGIEHYQKRDGTPLEKVSPDVVEQFPQPQAVMHAWVTT